MDKEVRLFFAPSFPTAAVSVLVVPQRSATVHWAPDTTSSSIFRAGLGEMVLKMPAATSTLSASVILPPRLPGKVSQWEVLRPDGEALPSTAGQFLTPVLPLTSVGLLAQGAVHPAGPSSNKPCVSMRIVCIPPGKELTE